MAIDASFWTSIISAASGLAGVALGGWITNKREADKEEIQRAKTIGYLGVLVTAHLDHFADQCATVAYDEGTSEGRPAGNNGEYHATTTEVPNFDPLSLSVDWKALPTDLMYEVLNLPQSQAQIERYLLVIWEYDDPPDFADFFFTRQLEYGRLSLRAIKLASRLRQQAGLPPYKTTVGSWEREVELADRVKTLESAKAARNAPVQSHLDDG